MIKNNNKLSRIILALTFWSGDCWGNDKECNLNDVYNTIVGDAQLLYKALNSLCIPIDYKPSGLPHLNLA